MYIVKMFMVPWSITLVVELAAALIWRVRSLKGISAVVWINTITNPMVTLIRWQSNLNIPSEIIRNCILAAAEIGVLFCEWRLFRRFVKENRHPFMLSLTLNGASFAAGLLSPYVFILLVKLGI